MAATIPMTFEDLMPMLGVSGHCAVYEGAATSAPPAQAPTTILKTDQSWFVHFDWQTTGLLNYYLAGTWELQVLLEEIGKGEFDLPSATATVAVVAAPNNYHRDIIIPAGVVPEGVYKIVTVLKMKGSGGVPGPIAAFGEGPMLQFYKVGP